MTQVFFVNYAQQCITTAPNELACSAMGSCIAVCLADRSIDMVGVSHIMLPSKTNMTPDESPAKYAQTAVEQLASDMVDMGADRSRLVAKIVGGATIYPDDVSTLNASIGQRNIVCVCNELSRLGIPMVSCDIGGDYGRSILVNAKTFEVKVRALSKGIMVI